MINSLERQNDILTVITVYGISARLPFGEIILFDDDGLVMINDTPLGLAGSDGSKSKHPGFKRIKLLVCMRWRSLDQPLVDHVDHSIPASTVAEKTNFQVKMPRNRSLSKQIVSTKI